VLDVSKFLWYLEELRLLYGDQNAILSRYQSIIFII